MRKSQPGVSEDPGPAPETCRGHGRRRDPDRDEPPGPAGPRARARMARSRRARHPAPPGVRPLPPGGHPAWPSRGRRPCARWTRPSSADRQIGVLTQHDADARGARSPGAAPDGHDRDDPSDAQAVRRHDPAGRPGARSVPRGGVHADDAVPPGPHRARARTSCRRPTTWKPRRSAVRRPTLFERIVELLPDAVRRSRLSSSPSAGDAGRMIDLIAATLPSLTTVERQTLLETPDVKARLKTLVESLTKEVEVLELGSKIHSQVQSEMTKTQREYYLREQLKAIQKELGEGDERGQELTELREKIEAAGMSEEAHREALRELDRLTKMPPAAAEYSVARTYLEWLVALPVAEGDAGRHRPRPRARGPRRGPLGARQDQGAPPRVPRGPQAPARGQGARSSASWARPASARRRSAGRSRARSGGSSTGSPSAACGTRPRSAVTGGRTSAPCPGRSSRGCGGPSPRTRCSCWTRSTSSAPTSAATRPRRCSRCSTRSRTRRSGTTTSTCRSISRGSCSSRPRTCSIRSRRRCATGWRSSSCPATPRTRRSRSPGATSRRSRPTEHGLGLDQDIDVHGAGAPAPRPQLHARGRRPEPRAGDRRALPEDRAAARRGRRPAGRPWIPSASMALLGSPRFLLEEEIAERTRTPGVAVGLAWTPTGGDVLFVEASRMAGRQVTDPDGPAGRRDEGVRPGRRLVGAGARGGARHRARISGCARTSISTSRPAPSRRTARRRA